MAKNSTKDFDYSGVGQCVTLSNDGYYKLEVWGASGYSYNSTYSGGNGGYSVGIYSSSVNIPIYIFVGGVGKGGLSNGTVYSAWPNGGTAKSDYASAGHPAVYSGGGGASTHISQAAKTISSHTTSELNKLLIVAGGGGTGTYCSNWSGRGGSGGGASGVTGIRIGTDSGNWSSGTGGTQTSGGIDASSNVYNGSFGQGGGGGTAGGGGGYYGGAGAAGSSGGGGSGYIGSSNLISGGGITKHMTCYSCTTSTAAVTRTNSNTNVSATARADYSKTGNGYARITYLGTSI